MKEDEIIKILLSYAITEENDDGVKTSIIWDDDFQEIAKEIKELSERK